MLFPLLWNNYWRRVQPNEGIIDPIAFQLKRMVNFATRGNRTLDLVISNLHKYYSCPQRAPPFGLSDHFTVTVNPTNRAQSRNGSSKRTVYWHAVKQQAVSISAINRLASTSSYKQRHLRGLPSGSI